MLETERHARLEKGESLFRHFVSFLVIGVYSVINNITGFSPYLEIGSIVLLWSLWTMVHLEGYIDTVHASEM
jgi:hypothetical protein